MMVITSLQPFITCKALEVPCKASMLRMII
jgi:hypothetical protein